MDHLSGPIIIRCHTVWWSTIFRVDTWVAVPATKIKNSHRQLTPLKMKSNIRKDRLAKKKPFYFPSSSFSPLHGAIFITDLIKTFTESIFRIVLILSLISSSLFFLSFLINMIMMFQPSSQNNFQSSKVNNGPIFWGLHFSNTKF